MKITKKMLMAIGVALIGLCLTVNAQSASAQEAAGVKKATPVVKSDVTKKAVKKVKPAAKVEVKKEEVKK